MYGCEVMWGSQKAGRVQQLVELSLGDTCPCKRGKRCPVIPVDVVLPAPRQPESIVLPEIA